MPVSSLLRAHARRPARLLTRRARLAAGAIVLAAGTFAGVGGIGIATPAAHAIAPSRPATAIAFELRQLGKPYVWGATGPSSYDCSGLTQAAYAYAGISIPRVANDQYLSLPHVPISQVQAGDLVFWGTDRYDGRSVYHVATYVGNGMIIAAPHSGTVVQIQPLFTADLMPYAARPAGRYANQVIPVQVGEKSNAVRDVQMRLRANGYDVKVDGEYGPSTYRIIHELQLQLGTPGSGLVGPNTWGWLISHGVRTHRS